MAVGPGGGSGHRLFATTLEQRLAIASVVTVAYFVTLAGSIGIFSAEALDLVVVPVATIGATLGTVAGIVAAPALLLATAAALVALGYPPAEGLGTPHVILAVVLGVGSGLLRDVVGSARWRATTLGAVVANAPVVLWVTDAAGRFLLRDGQALARLGGRPGDGVGQDARSFWRSFVPDAAPRLAAELDRALAGEIRKVMVHTRGLALDAILTPLRDGGGKVQGVVGVTVDVTERDAAERDLRRSHARLDAILSSARDAIITVDAGGRIVIFNAAAERMFGYSAADMMGGPVARLIPESARIAHERDVAEYVAGRSGAGHQLDRPRPLSGRRSCGEEFPIEATLSHVAMDGEALATVIVRDVSERRQLDAQLEHLALYDQLTELPNRTLFGDRCGLALAAAVRERGTFAALIADLDNFADVNVGCGTEVGDATLREVAARLRSAVRDIDTVARISGDKFALLIPGADVAAATDAAARVLEALARPFRCNDRELELSASIGIATWPEDGPDHETVIAHAEIAMYRAKRERARFRIYGDPTDGASLEDIELSGEIRAAIEQREIKVVFQPEVRASDGSLLRMEALARWTHPVLGAICPMRLVRLAERSGHLPDFTRLILDSALEEVSRWRTRGEGTAVAVNLTASDLMDDQLVTSIGELLERHGVAPSSLTLEVTETALLTDFEVVVPRLRALRALGLSVAIDDFGTGYSSLSYLDRLPVSDVKIDRSFVARMTSDLAAASIVRATIGLGHDLGLTVVAEGVETADQLRLLRSMGCDAIQGYFISHPLDPGSAMRWIETGRWTSGEGSAVAFAD